MKLSEKLEKINHAWSIVMLIMGITIGFACLFVWIIMLFIPKAHALDIVSSPTNAQSSSWSHDWYLQNIQNMWWGLFVYYYTSASNWAVLIWSWLALQPDYNITFSVQNIAGWIDYVRLRCGIPFSASCPWWASFDYVVNRNTNKSTFLWAYVTPFISGNILSRESWGNIVSYYISDFTGSSVPSPIQTVPKPSPAFWSYVNTYAINYTANDWSNFFLYTGTDGKGYKVLGTFESWSDLPINSSSGMQVIPMWPFIPDGTVLAYQSWSQWWGIYLPYVSSFFITGALVSDYRLRFFTKFENPLAYFMTNSGTIVKWDMNCKTTWYSSCRLFWSVFKCASEAWVQSPAWELCGWTVYPPNNWTGVPISTTWFVWCQTIDYPIFSSWSYSIGAGAFSDSQESDGYKFQWLANSNTYQDRFSVYPFYSWTILNTDTFTGWLEAWVDTTFSPGIGSTVLQTLSVSLARSGSSAPINYVKVKTGFPGNNYFATAYNNIVANVQYNTPNWVFTYPMTWSWWYATSFSRYDANSIKISWLANDTITISWFEAWHSSTWSTISKTNCGNTYFSCSYHQQQPGIFSCDSSRNVDGSAQWTCIDQSNQCKPASQTWAYYWPGVYIPGVTTITPITNWSGDTVGIDYTWEDIFSCSESGLLVLVCPFQVLGRIWDKFTSLIKTIVNLIYGISSLWSPRWTGDIIGMIIPYAHADPGVNLKMPYQNNPDWSMKNDSAQSYTWRDMMGLNKGILRASDSLANTDSWWIKWLYAYSMWTMIVIWVFVVIAIIVTAIIT